MLDVGVPFSDHSFSVLFYRGLFPKFPSLWSKPPLYPPPKNRPKEIYLELLFFSKTTYSHPLYVSPSRDTGPWSLTKVKSSWAPPISHLRFRSFSPLPASDLWYYSSHMSPSLLSKDVNLRFSCC